MNLKSKVVSAVLAAVLTAGSVGAEMTFTDISVSAKSSKLAAPENLAAKKVTYNSVTLKWDKVKGADAYGVYRYDSSKEKFKKIKTVTKTTYKVTKLSAETEYTFYVAALVENEDGEYEKQEKSEELAVTTKANEALDVAAPDNFTVTKKSTDYVVLTWDKVKKADAYKVELYNSSKGVYEKVKSTTKNKCKITGLEAGTKYIVRVTSLVKVDGKYKAANYKNVNVTTAEKSSSSGKSDSTSGSGYWSTPDFGDSMTTALSKANLKDYTITNNSDGTTTISGVAKITSSNDYASLEFNKSGQLYQVTMTYSASYSDYLDLWSDWCDTYTWDYDDGYDYFLASDGLIVMHYNFELNAISAGVRSYTYEP